MRQRVYERHEAIRLRKTGHSYKEISKILSVSKSSLSGWCRNIQLSTDEADNIYYRLKAKIIEGRFNTCLTNRKRRLQRDVQASNEAIEEYGRFTNDPLFAHGVCLYWAEGSKANRQFSFINSDPNMIRVMVQWIEKYLGVSRLDLSVRVSMHRVYEGEKCEEYWSNIVGIPLDRLSKTVYKQSPHEFKRNPSYKGCCTLRGVPVTCFVKMMVWQKMMIEAILQKDIVPVAQWIEHQASNLGVGGSNPSGHTLDEENKTV